MIIEPIVMVVVALITLVLALWLWACHRRVSIRDEAISVLERDLKSWRSVAEMLTVKYQNTETLLLELHPRAPRRCPSCDRYLWKMSATHANGCPLRSQVDQWLISTARVSDSDVEKRNTMRPVTEGDVTTFRSG